MMTLSEQYMHRCLELASLGAGHVAPNPMVGAVLVYEDRIIGEGYHQQYGKAHAEVNCINSVKDEDRHLIPSATLYVSLEPCAHFGKTPPCADLIIREKIKKVVVGCRDPFKQVDGRGIEKLRNAGVEVITDVLNEQCKLHNKRFFTFHTQYRPYIILKWAQTADGRIAAATSSQRLLISNEYTNRLVHRWRSEEPAILIATNTALNDNPRLNTRLWPGKNPLRLVIDMDLRLPASLHIYDKLQPTVVFNKHQHSLDFNVKLSEPANDLLGYYQVTEDVSIVQQVMNACYQMNIQSVLVEGGARLLQSFIGEDTWDEARIITNENLTIGEGLAAPLLLKALHNSTEQYFTDKINYFTRIHE